MENLSEPLQRTIKAVEMLNNIAESEQLDGLLDQLFQQKIDLVHLRCNPASPAYQQASQSLNYAASKAEKAVNDPTLSNEAILSINDAINKLASLFNHLSS